MLKVTVFRSTLSNVKLVSRAREQILEGLTGARAPSLKPGTVQNVLPSIGINCMGTTEKGAEAKGKPLPRASCALADPALPGDTKFNFDNFELSIPWPYSI